MSYFCGTIAWGTTGIKTIACGFQPTSIRVRVSGRFSGTDNDSHLSIGSGSTTSSRVDAFFNDGSNIQTVAISSKVIHHMEFDGTNIVPVIEATIDSFNATNFKLNVSKTTSSYNVFVEAFA